MNWKDRQSSFVNEWNSFYYFIFGKFSFEMIEWAKVDIPKQWRITWKRTGSQLGSGVSKFVLKTEKNYFCKDPKVFHDNLPVFSVESAKLDIEAYDLYATRYFDRLTEDY